MNPPDITFEELELAKDEVRNKINELPKDSITIVDVNAEAATLAETYINEGALTRKSYHDALHIALATIHYADVLASWNFKHIVNPNRIRLYNLINLRMGYNMIEIKTPREIINLDSNNK